MQVGVRKLASSLGLTGLRKLVQIGAIPAPVVASKFAFKAPIGESNAELVKNRAALGKMMESVAYRGMQGVNCKNYPELTEYVSVNCTNAIREVPLISRVADFIIVGNADFVFNDTHNKRILSEYKISLKRFPNTTDYLQAVLYALMYNRSHSDYIDNVEWMNPITGHHCRLITTPSKLREKNSLEKIISVYIDKINDQVKSG
jgi:hypothetical protein